MRRDIYNVLLNPLAPYVPREPSAAAAAAATAGEVPLEVILAAKQTDGAYTAFLFTDREAALPEGFTILPGSMLLDAIARMGEAEPHPWAATCAFEQFLSGIVQRAWQPAQAAKLSVGSQIAFTTSSLLLTTYYLLLTTYYLLLTTYYLLLTTYYLLLTRLASSLRLGGK